MTIDKSWEKKDEYTLFSITSTIPDGVGKERKEDLVGYHPRPKLGDLEPASIFSTKLNDDQDELEMIISEDGGWANFAVRVISPLRFRQDPKNENRLFAEPEPEPNDDSWVLVGAAMYDKISNSDDFIKKIKSKNEQRELMRLMDGKAVKSLILTWKTEGWDESIYTCWKWP